jgi:2-haloalkanoic acid dehalogenase type II
MAAQSKDIPSLTHFKALSFDCYGTLIDWETGLRGDLQPFLSQLDPSHEYAQDFDKLLNRFFDISTKLEVSQPTLRYTENFVQTLNQLCEEAKVSLPASVIEAFGISPGTWVAFPDTVAALATLKKHYKLTILSNVDNANINSTVSKNLAPIEFDGVYTAEDIGSYKPSHRNFNYLFDRVKRELGIDTANDELLHVAVSLTFDHVPAKELGLRSVWISRGSHSVKKYSSGAWIEDIRDKVGFEWQFTTLGDFAEEVERQFGGEHT